MSAKEVEREKARISKAIGDKLAKDRAQLKSIDALIEKLSPGKIRKTRNALKRLHSAHKTRLRARAEKKELQKLKAKATRAFKQRAKTAKLDRGEHRGSSHTDGESISYGRGTYGGKG